MAPVLGPAAAEGAQRTVRDIRTLNSNLPTQTISIVFSDRQLQFDPPLEDIRGMHYRNHLDAFFGLPGQVCTTAYLRPTFSQQVMMYNSVHAS